MKVIKRIIITAIILACIHYVVAMFVDETSHREIRWIIWGHVALWIGAILQLIVYSNNHSKIVNDSLSIEEREKLVEIRKKELEVARGEEKLRSDIEWRKRRDND